MTDRSIHNLARSLIGAAPAGDAVAGVGPGRADAAILLVEDSVELLESLARLVGEHGYRPDRALGGREALSMLSRRRYDVVLLDLVMPDMAGQEVLEQAAAQGQGARFIVLSGDASYAGVKHAMRCGAFDFVKKPFDPSELMASLEAALERCRRDAELAAADLRLESSESLHRFMVDNSPDLVYLLDRHGCFTFLNGRVETLLGFRREELLGRHYSEIVEPEHLEPARRAFDERRTGARAAHNVEVKLRSRLRREGPRRFHEQGVWVELTAMGVYENPRERTRESFVGSYGTARDISERKEAEEQINFQAYHDLLTRLPNRALLRDRLSLAIAQAERNKRKLAVMFLDLDRFKAVNDSLGHTMGDRLLKAVANRLQGCLRSGDTLARFGGDEFMLLLPEVRTRDDVVVIAEKILDRLSSPFGIDGHELFVGASIGIAMYPEAGDREETLVQSADIAMYNVKGSERNGYQFFSEALHREFSTRLSMERELRKALAREDLSVVYQPQIDLGSGHVCGVEALVRWCHPVHGAVDPAQFIALAEETSLAAHVDAFVQQQAFRDVAGWRAQGFDALRVSVNVSPVQAAEDDFVTRFVAAVESAGLDPAAVTVEITENTLLRDIERNVRKLRELRSCGVRITLDDFGTGYSSLSYLHQFPVNALKVDRSFVAAIRSDHGGTPVVDAIGAVARGLGLRLIADGVENRTQLGYLRARGCREAQGFVFSEALPAADLPALLADNPFRQLVLDAVVGEAGPRDVALREAAPPESAAHDVASSRARTALPVATDD